uniref:Uncharacterized protein n=1 Tax=viral metagenome TaxID=1070528 RepID=A0A6M3X5V9_9ZZZZ
MKERDPGWLREENETMDTIKISKEAHDLLNHMEGLDVALDEKIAVIIWLMKRMVKKGEYVNG